MEKKLPKTETERIKRTLFFTLKRNYIFYYLFNGTQFMSFFLSIKKGEKGRGKRKEKIDIERGNERKEKEI